jgi:RHS repeat-associated protein
VHTDHLNAPRKVAQPSTGTLVWRWDTDPFGTAAPNQNPAGLGTFSYNLRYPGQYYDSETGLLQSWNRDYDPIVGRYVESDPIGLQGGINTYRYVADRPTMAADSTGLVLRGPGLSDAQWKQIQAAEQQIRSELSKACSCPRGGVNGCIPCDPTLLTNLKAALNTSTVYPGTDECGSAQVGAKWLKLAPAAYTNPGCQCLAVVLYHELLHDAGLSHDDPAGDRVTELDKECRGNLCHTSDPVIIGIQ